MSCSATCACPAHAVAAKDQVEAPKPEVADVFRLGAQAYLAEYGPPLHTRRIIAAILGCRTAVMGGHREICDHCHFERNAYNSCRNRHCPKCQTAAKEKWRKDREAEILHVQYFHNVFTLPHELNGLMLCNKRVLLGVLFKAVAETLLAFGKNNLGGQMGFTAVLHTWDQKLNAHYHIHCLIPGGVLTKDKSEWKSSKPDYLFPVENLREVFRGKFLDKLMQAREAKELHFTGSARHLESADQWNRLIRDLRSKSWVVYSKAPFSGPEKTLDYLARYTHKIAISNYRIQAIKDGMVTFTYRDRSLDLENQEQTMELSIAEFIRRFLLHVLPQGFMRIRHYGFLANRYKADNLEICRSLLGQPEPPAKDHIDPLDDFLARILGDERDKCPNCKRGPLRRVSIPKQKITLDTS